MERTLSSDTEESFKSIPGSIRNSLRHIDLIVSTSIHVWPLRMKGKLISNREDQEAARPLRIVIKFGAGFHFIAYPNSPCILSLQIFNTFPFSYHKSVQGLLIY